MAENKSKDLFDKLNDSELINSSLLKTPSPEIMKPPPKRTRKKPAPKRRDSKPLSVLMSPFIAKIQDNLERGTGTKQKPKTQILQAQNTDRNGLISTLHAGEEPPPRSSKNINVIGNVIVKKRYSARLKENRNPSPGPTGDIETPGLENSPEEQTNKMAVNTHSGKNKRQSRNSLKLAIQETPPVGTSNGRYVSTPYPNRQAPPNFDVSAIGPASTPVDPSGQSDTPEDVPPPSKQPRSKCSTKKFDYDKPTRTRKSRRDFEDMQLKISKMYHQQSTFRNRKSRRVAPDKMPSFDSGPDSRFLHNEEPDLVEQATPQCPEKNNCDEASSAEESAPRPDSDEMWEAQVKALYTPEQQTHYNKNGLTTKKPNESMSKFEATTRPEMRDTACQYSPPPDSDGEEYPAKECAHCSRRSVGHPNETERTGVPLIPPSEVVTSPVGNVRQSADEEDKAPEVVKPLPRRRKNRVLIQPPTETEVPAVSTQFPMNGVITPPQELVPPVPAPRRQNLRQMHTGESRENLYRVLLSIQPKPAPRRLIPAVPAVRQVADNCTSEDNVGAQQIVSKKNTPQLQSPKLDASRIRKRPSSSPAAEEVVHVRNASGRNVSHERIASVGLDVQEQDADADGAPAELHVPDDDLLVPGISKNLLQRGKSPKRKTTVGQDKPLPTPKFTTNNNKTSHPCAACQKMDQARNSAPPVLVHVKESQNCECADVQTVVQQETDSSGRDKTSLSTKRRSKRSGGKSTENVASVVSASPVAEVEQTPPVEKFKYSEFGFSLDEDDPQWNDSPPAVRYDTGDASRKSEQRISTLRAKLVSRRSSKVAKLKRSHQPDAVCSQNKIDDIAPSFEEFKKSFPSAANSSSPNPDEVEEPVEQAAPTEHEDEAHVASQLCDSDSARRARQDSTRQRLDFEGSTSGGRQLVVEMKRIEEFDKKPTPVKQAERPKRNTLKLAKKAAALLKIESTINEVVNNFAQLNEGTPVTPDAVAEDASAEQHASVVDNPPTVAPSVNNTSMHPKSAKRNARGAGTSSSRRMTSVRNESKPSRRKSKVAPLVFSRDEVLPSVINQPGQSRYGRTLKNTVRRGIVYYEVSTKPRKGKQEKEAQVEKEPRRPKRKTKQAAAAPHRRRLDSEVVPDVVEEEPRRPKRKTKQAAAPHRRRLDSEVVPDVVEEEPRRPKRKTKQAAAPHRRRLDSEVVPDQVEEEPRTSKRKTKQAAAAPRRLDSEVVPDVAEEEETANASAASMVDALNKSRACRQRRQSKDACPTDQDCECPATTDVLKALCDRDLTGIPLDELCETAVCDWDMKMVTVNPGEVVEPTELRQLMFGFVAVGCGYLRYNCSYLPIDSERRCIFTIGPGTYYGFRNDSEKPLLIFTMRN